MRLRLTQESSGCLLFGKWLGVLLILLGCLASSQAANDAPSDYEVKAAFLGKFADFIEWPAEAFTNSHGRFVIGILGKDPFGSLLERVFRDQQIQGRPLEIRRIAADGEATGCHIVFISSAVRPQYGVVVRRIQRAGLLTVGDGEGFCRAGGLIGFYKAGPKVQFAINVSRARVADLKISSRLLALSRVIEEPMPTP